MEAPKTGGYRRKTTDFIRLAGDTRKRIRDGPKKTRARVRVSGRALKMDVRPVAELAQPVMAVRTDH
jgi:hypothetical protein